MINVAILGASGFVGKNLMLKLPSDWNTYAFYNTSKDFVDFIKKNNIKATLIKKDLSSDFKISNRYPHHFDLVISLLGNTSHIAEELQPEYDLNSDPLAITNFFKKFSCKKLIYFSSTAIYDNHYHLVSAQKTTDIMPSNSYTIAKLMSERLVHYFQKKKVIDEFLIVRLSGAYGPYQRPNRLISRLINTFHFKKGNYIKLKGTGKNWTDAMYVKDTVNFILLAVEQKLKNEIVDFCSPCFIPLDEMVDNVVNVVKSFDSDLKPTVAWDNIKLQENYPFYLSSKAYGILPPFNYKFRWNWDTGLANFRSWLASHPEYLPKE